ncbi:MAG TPA: cation-translocating P-type ATPase [Methylophilaceae bacterium]
MQAALLTPHEMIAPIAEISRWDALDDPEEWAVFGQPITGTQAELWESNLAIEGMHCAACSLHVEQALMSVNGVVSAEVNATSARARVIWSAATTKPSDWMRAISQAGYNALPATDSPSFELRRKQQRLALWRWLVAGFCMLQVMMYTMPAYVSGFGDMTPDIRQLLQWAAWVLTLPVIIFSCGPFFSNAWRDIKQRQISMDFPVSLGIIITFSVSTAATFQPTGWWGNQVYFDSLTMFVFFLLTGRWLELRMRSRTAGALEDLMRRLPDSVDRKNADGSFSRVAVRRLMLGDVVRVLPGESFPADGTIVLGETQVDEALLTGESRPVVRGLGSAVIAGSHNLNAAVLQKVEQLGKSTRYAQIVALMERASIDKPRLALLADRMSRPFILLVLLAATGAAAFWWHTDPGRALMAAVAVLVVTCPCALSLATPAAMLASAGSLARRGVLVRRLQALEALAEIDTVIFDKTGTLTSDSMHVVLTTARKGVSSEDAFQTARAIAQHSKHPVSRALVAAGNAQPADSVSDVIEISGQGLTANSGFGQVRLGSAKFCGIDITPTDSVQVHLTDKLGWLASFVIDEDIRPDARIAVQALQDAGIQVQVLSGDRLQAVQRIATQIGISIVAGDCSPQDKLTHLQFLQKHGKSVAMIGDGLNDGPVLASAHVSVAMGDAVPVAQAQSDFVVLSGQLILIPQLLMQARRTMHIVRQNLLWAAAYNAVCVPLAVMGWLSAWVAGLGMALSSLIVIMNAARLARMDKAA